ncbi:MAG: GIY-YIG nuclease family protein, partial [Alphaproteobacteria bacterium]|nr:GIY-YIG nuclease family protein [Alphaproteobacteria bacterium]
MSPGIYKMYDGDGNLLYVGKAKNLSNRLHQYVDISKLETHKQIMRTLVRRVEWEITQTESDALLLEQKLIKTLKPKYNIMLTDGKMYPMLALTKHEFPRLLKFRGKISQKKDVFGPYPSVRALNETIKTIQRVCKLRTCNDTFMNNRARPCLLYQIGRCSAPCCIEQTDYEKNVQLARRVLTGDSEPIIADLTQQMKDFSDKQDFENAAIMRDKISALTQTLTRGIRQKSPYTANLQWDKNVTE